MSKENQDNMREEARAVAKNYVNVNTVKWIMGSNKQVQRAKHLYLIFKF